MPTTEPTIKITEPIIDELNIAEGEESVEEMNDWEATTEQGF